MGKYLLTNRKNIYGVFFSILLLSVITPGLLAQELPSPKNLKSLRSSNRIPGLERLALVESFRSSLIDSLARKITESLEVALEACPLLEKLPFTVSETCARLSRDTRLEVSLELAEKIPPETFKLLTGKIISEALFLSMPPLEYQDIPIKQEELERSLHGKGNLNHELGPLQVITENSSSWHSEALIIARKTSDFEKFLSEKLSDGESSSLEVEILKSYPDFGPEKRYRITPEHLLNYLEHSFFAPGLAFEIVRPGRPAARKPPLEAARIFLESVRFIEASLLSCGMYQRTGELPGECGETLSPSLATLLEKYIRDNRTDYEKKINELTAGFEKERRIFFEKIFTLKRRIARHTGLEKGPEIEKIEILPSLKAGEVFDKRSGIFATGKVSFKSPPPGGEQMLEIIWELYDKTGKLLLSRRNGISFNSTEVELLFSSGPLNNNLTGELDLCLSVRAAFNEGSNFISVPVDETIRYAGISLPDSNIYITGSIIKGEALLDIQNSATVEAHLKTSIISGMEAIKALEDTRFIRGPGRISIPFAISIPEMLSEGKYLLKVSIDCGPVHESTTKEISVKSGDNSLLILDMRPIGKKSFEIANMIAVDGNIEKFFEDSLDIQLNVSGAHSGKLFFDARSTGGTLSIRGTRLNFRADADGIYTITAIARDQHGRTAEQQVQVRVYTYRVTGAGRLR